jgi:lipoprotein-anchoring transpeptidase ErfK/SrfK
MPVSPSAPRTRLGPRMLAAGATAVAVVLALGACTSPSGTGPGGGLGAGSPSAAPTPDPTLAVTQPIPFDAPATFSVRNGTLESAVVRGHLHGTPLPGSVQPDGTTWVSDALPTPSASYDVSAQVRAADGSEHTLTARLLVATLAPKDKLGYSVTPLNGWTVGVNAPIVIRFDKPVQDRAAVESVLTVSTTTPLVGSWHWVNSVEVHFRPQTTWPAHSQVRLDVELASVKTGASQWGATDTTLKFGIGDVHLTRVDGKKHTLTVLVNGKTWAVWPTSLGRPEFVTRTGYYTVLAKQPTRRMTSCNAGITCSPSNPNFYDLTVNWDVRLTYSGTFIHSAPWSVRSQGVDNVSHGCINLSPAHATAYFNLARYGDLVTVTGTSRTSADLVRSGDPGMADWNMTWTQYAAGSALNGAITTQPLPTA